MEQKNQTKKLPGFYIALCCCVTAIGVAGFFAQNKQAQPTTVVTQTSESPIEQTLSPTEDFTPVSSTESIVIEEPTPITVPPTPQPNITPAKETISYEEDYTFDNPDIAPVSVNVNVMEECLFEKPVNDTVVLEGFSGDTLLYNKVYKDWRSHNGIDFDCPTGTNVCASADGTIRSVSDGSYGKQIAIEHPNGFTTIYAQLDNIVVNPGDAVSQGSVIGTVAESIGENVKKPHLHFEILKDGKYENPEMY